MLIWIGDQKGVDHIPGIPPRDLSDEEVKQYEEETLLKTGCWVKRVDKAHRRDTAREDDQLRR